MPQEINTLRTQKRSPCYNPTSMDKYNPIIGNRRPATTKLRTSRFTMTPVMWGLLVIFLITLAATVYLTYSVVHDAAASR